MTYATIADLKGRVPAADLERLTDPDGSHGGVSDARLQHALDDAAAEINSMIAKRVSLPIAEVPAMLRTVARDLAIWRLAADAGWITDAHDRLRKAAIAYLKMVGEGSVALGDETGGEEVQTSPGSVLVEGPERTMTRDTLGGF